MKTTDTAMTPLWLHLLSILSLLLAALTALIIAVHEVRHPQHMWIMNVVWPVVALFGSLIALWAYFRYGVLASREAMMAAKRQGDKPPNKARKPFAAMVGEGAAHCGSGCALGDIAAEALAYVVPSVAVWFGWQSLFAEKVFAVWVLDFIFAFVIGIFFQYFTIAPMRGLSLWPGIAAALKADTLSLTAWQIGMYASMAFAQFYLFRGLLGIKLEPASAEFWFMMQIAMIAGFLTSYPVNWWLLTAGIKEKM